MTEQPRCNSTIRDKYNHCVKCGVEIFAGYAGISTIDEHGNVFQERDTYVVCHVY